MQDTEDRIYNNFTLRPSSFLYSSSLFVYLKKQIIVRVYFIYCYRFVLWLASFRSALACLLEQIHVLTDVPSVYTNVSQ